MKPNSGGRPRKRGTEKQHTSQRIEKGDKAWLDQQAAHLTDGSVPDLIHAMVAAARIPGTDANRILVLSAQVVHLETTQESLRRIAGKFRASTADAHAKNYQLAQKLRAAISAIMSLPPTIRDTLPERLAAQAKRIVADNAVPEQELVVL